MQITSETLNLVFVVTQILLTVGGTVFAIRKWFTEPLREENSRTKQALEEFKSETEQRFEGVDKTLKNVDNRIREIEVKLPETYLRQDQFLILHNKFEATIHHKLESLEKSIRELQRFLMEGKV